RDLVGFSSCDHPICAECCLKVFVFNEKAVCPKCRNQFSNVIFDKFPNKTYDEYPIENLIGLNLPKLMAANKDTQDSICSILSYNCKCCEKFCANENELIHHLEFSHGLFLCELCIRNLNFFPKDFAYYSNNDLRLHTNCEKTGHPHCGICNKSFFNTDQLIAHRRKDHVTCPLCPDIYFPNVSLLKTHARNLHFLCESGQCSDENVLTVFSNDSELIDHRVFNSRIICHFSELSRKEYKYIDSSRKSRESRNCHKNSVGGLKTESSTLPFVYDPESFPSLISGDSRSKSVQTANAKPKNKPPATPTQQYESNFPLLTKKSALPPVIPFKPPPKAIPTVKLPSAPPKTFSYNVEDFPSLPSQKYVFNHQKQKKKPPIKIEAKNSPEPNSISLLDRLTDVCENYQPKIDDFLVLSGKYHQKKITATSYMKGGNSILGRANMDKLLPYLVESLDGDLKKNLIESTKNKKKYLYLDI
ncbi:hypothetical protein MXB_4010, partial [Myxobolus squamalis]